MGIDGQQGDLEQRVGRWKYWDVFEDTLADYDADKHLKNSTEIFRACEDRVASRAESQDKDVSQVKRTVAGDYFQAFIALSIVEVATENGYQLELDPQTDDVPELEATSRDISSEDGDADEDYSLEPDTDIVLFEPDSDSPIYIFSCKTSLRERLAQSGMWKLYYENAEYDCSDPSCPTHQYELPEETDRDFYVGFITLDWYNEIPSNTIVPLLDMGYTGNPDTVNRDDGIYPLSELPDHIENDWSGVEH